MTEQQNRIFNQIYEERIRQDLRHPLPKGFQSDLRMAILTEEVGEVSRALLEYQPVQMREELIQVAAVAMRWVEVLDREALDSMNRMVEAGISPEQHEIEAYHLAIAEGPRSNEIKQEDSILLKRYESALRSIIKKCEGSQAYTNEAYAHYYAFSALNAHANDLVDGKLACIGEDKANE